MSRRAPPDPYGAFVDRLEVPDGHPTIAVKDMISVAGLRQMAGLAVRRDRVAERDAEVVRRARAKGYAIAGTTVSDAAGFGTMTAAVENPVDPDRAVGGSSGGAAAAVAGGLADFGLGTDTGGSVRIPAAYCELFAFKPSNGRASLEGVLPLARSFDAVGVLAHDFDRLEEGARLILDDWRAPAPAAARFVRSSSAEAVCAPEVLTTCERVTKSLPPLNDPIPYQTLASAHSTIICGEALTVHGEDFSRDPAGFPEVAAAGLAFAKSLSASQIAQARSIVDHARAAYEELLAPNTVMVLPTLPIPPARRHAETAQLAGEMVPITNANIRLTLFANVARLPVVLAPLAGLSLQFVGAPDSDELLLQHTRAFLSALRNDAA